MKKFKDFIKEEYSFEEELWGIHDDLMYATDNKNLAGVINSFQDLEQILNALPDDENEPKVIEAKQKAKIVRHRLNQLDTIFDDVQQIYDLLEKDPNED